MVLGTATTGHTTTDPAYLVADDCASTAYQIAVEHSFETAHRPPHLGGKCTSLRGRSWRVAIPVIAPRLNEDATVVEFGALKAGIRQWIDARLDHGTILGVHDPLVEPLVPAGCKGVPRRARSSSRAYSGGCCARSGSDTSRPISRRRRHRAYGHGHIGGDGLQRLTEAGAFGAASPPTHPSSRAEEPGGQRKSEGKFVVENLDELDETQEQVTAYDLHPVWVMPAGTDSATVLTRMPVLADPVLARGWHLSPRLRTLLWENARGR